MAQNAGGIGSALAHAFQARGLLVFAAVRNPHTVAELEKLQNVHVLVLDVTSSESIAAAAETVKTITTGKGLDILVNKSGVGYTMPLLDASLEEGRRLFKVNVWGVLALI
ncbi:hypothetical protein MMC25_000367 [Agyrium rufum]|nr:hypothetical protein [Agyrium rufum]